jgi:endonuclease/exonuclease/phosphatase family metal-dependent hydrolase
VEYRPDTIIAVTPFGKAAGLTGSKRFTAVTWNMGYGGLDASTDFFMDGGRMSQPKSMEAVLENTAIMLQHLEEIGGDVKFIQEVDRKSDRTFDIDQVELFSKRFPMYQGWFSSNFKVFFVPTPPINPVGEVHSGILTMTKLEGKESHRHQLPGFYRWPVRMFHLKRCMQVTRVENYHYNKDLYLINLHLSAFDPGGRLREQQLEYVKNFVVPLFDDGHYVVVGGDWNSMFPGIAKEHFGPYGTAEKDLYWVQKIPDGWTPLDWTWAYDSSTPTARSLEDTFIEGDNFETIIDGFLLSPNLELVEVKGHDLGFELSDHNPVQVTVEPAVPM